MPERKNSFEPRVIEGGDQFRHVKQSLRNLTGSDDLLDCLEDPCLSREVAQLIVDRTRKHDEDDSANRSESASMYPDGAPMVVQPMPGSPYTITHRLTYRELRGRMLDQRRRRFEEMDLAAGSAGLSDSAVKRVEECCDPGEYEVCTGVSSSWVSYQQAADLFYDQGCCDGNLTLILHWMGIATRSCDNGVFILERGRLWGSAKEKLFLSVFAFQRVWFRRGIVFFADTRDGFPSRTRFYGFRRIRKPMLPSGKPSDVSA